MRARCAGLVGELQPDPGAEIGKQDRFISLALLAAREALTDARIVPVEWGRRMALVFATCSGPMLTIEKHYERISNGKAEISPGELFAKRLFSGAAILARVFRISGPGTTVVTACSASTAAFGVAADLIRAGWVDCALVGGSDAMASSTLVGFDGLRATCAGECAPFSRPVGLNLGEGAGFLVIEGLDTAQKRGAGIYAEIMGYGLSNDAYHCSSPDPGGRGLATAMDRALVDAGLPPDRITYINAHGTGTEANDKAETKAVHRVMGSSAGQMRMSSTKSMVGHCLGAAGAVEAIASIAGMKSGVYPPTANFSGPREGCTLDYLPDAGRKWNPVGPFMSNNAAFGGHNASIVFAPYSDSNQPPDRAVGEAIVISACGVVSPIGIGTEAFSGALKAGKAACSSGAAFGLADYRVAAIDEACVASFSHRLDLSNMDRSSRWATIAARLALREGGFPEKPAALADVGYILSLSTGPTGAETELLTSLYRNNFRIQEVVNFPFIVPSSVAGNACRELMIKGHNLTVSGGPGAGLMSLALAVNAIRNGHANAILCGAVDELSERILTDLSTSGEMTPNDPILRGEGSVTLLVETESSARKRGVTPLGVIRGMAFKTEAFRAPESGDGNLAFLTAFREALLDAGTHASAVGAVCGSLGREGRDGVVRALGVTGDAFVDVSPQTGYLDAANPLLDLCAFLNGASAMGTAANTAVVAMSSPAGSCGAMVVEKLQGARP